MAHTLFYKSSKDLPRPRSYIRTPPSSWALPSFQVPDVFLIAPEEENAPPWLLFDAAKDSNHNLSHSPDLDFLDVALDAWRRVDTVTTPIFRSEPGEETGEHLDMSRRDNSHSMPRPVVDEEIPWPGMQGVESEGDSVVVEVVKVRKADGMQDAGEGGRTMKKSQSFKAVASKAFRSIKNAARGSNRKPSAQDIWPSSSSVHSSHAARISKEELPPQAYSNPPRPNTPTTSRRGSLTLTQLFQTPNKKIRSSSETSDSAISTTCTPLEIDFPAASPDHQMRHLSPTETEEPLNFPNDDQGQIRMRPSYPKESSFRRRLSMLELRRVFTSSKSSDSLETSSIATMSPDGSTNSSAPSTSTEASFETPGTPDAAYMSTSMPSLHARKVWGDRNGEAHIAEPELGGDVSFEMRLESLHFDSLSFDPDTF